MTEPNSRFGAARPVPPTRSQFKKGQSGNPAGRPKGAKSFRTVIKEAASKKLAVIEDGKRKKKSKMELMATQMMNKAAKGEPRATQMAMAQLYKDDGGPSVDRTGDVFEEADLPVVENIIARIRRSSEQLG